MNVIVELEKPLLELEAKIADLKKLNETQRVDLSGSIAALEEKSRQLKLEIFANLTPLAARPLGAPPPPPIGARLHQRARWVH